MKSEAAIRINELLLLGPSDFTKAHYEEIQSLYFHIDLENEENLVSMANKIVSGWYSSGSLNFMPEWY